MENLGRIKLGKNLYSYFSGFRDKTTGKFAKTGERFFEFSKLRKTQNFSTNGLYETVKHKDMSSLGVGTGRTISKALYYLKKPAVKAGLVGIAALAAGYGIYSIFKNFNENKDAYIGKQDLYTVQTVNVDFGEHYTNSNKRLPDSLYVVQKDDNMWNINKDRLKDKGQTPTNTRVSSLTNETIRKNPQAKENGNLIYEGDTLVVPKIDYEL